MGEGQLLAATAALTTLAALGALAPAQGPLYRERWGFQLLEHRRHEVLEALRDRPPEVHAEIAALLAVPENGQPFASVAQALARLRSVAGDDSFHLRTAIGAYVLPEVCDPQASKELCRTVHVTVFLPTPLPLPGAVAFDLVVRDATGAERWRLLFDRVERSDGIAVEDLRTGQVTASVPCADWPDGTYRLDVVTRIDGKPPAANSPSLSWEFHLLRGYQARAEAALTAAVRVGGTLPALAQAIVLGMGERVQRAYYGEAFAVRSEAVVELERLERVLKNVEKGESVLAGLTGDVALALPDGKGGRLAAVLRPAVGDGPRPLLLIASGTPCYDLSPRRPSAPATRDPAWTAHAFAGFAKERGWHQVFLESPGGGRDYAAALSAVLPSLRALLPGGAGPVVLVAEREAASVVGLQLQRLRAEFAGVALVGAGVFPRPVALATAGLPIRFGRMHGTPANDAMANLIGYCAETKEPAGLDVRWLADGDAAWPMALPLFAAGIESFAAAVFAAR